MMCVCDLFLFAKDSKDVIALNCSFLVLQKQNKKVEYLAASVWTSNFFLLPSVGTGSVQILRCS
jgi:hypothetical protein